jgi:hypothetical protein
MVIPVMLQNNGKWKWIEKYIKDHLDTKEEKERLRQRHGR